MTETAFLGGKLRKCSLPVFHPPVPREAAGPKRLLLPQGELANFYDDDEGIRYAALIQLQPGGIRGNHLHRVKKEGIYLISGRLELVAQAGTDGIRVTVTMEPGDLVTIETGVAHAMRPLEQGLAVEYSPTRFDPSDVERFTLI